MPLLEEPYYEPTIREWTRADLVDAGPVEVEGQDYPIVAGEIATGQPYLVDVEVRVAGGGGSALVLDVDYTVQLRTGVVSVLPGGALDGQTDAWIAFSHEGIDNIPIRQLGNRTAAIQTLAADLDDRVNLLEASSGASSGFTVVGATPGVTGVATDFTVDFTGLSLEPGDALFVLTGGPDIAPGAPAGEGWDHEVHAAFGSTYRQGLFYKVWDAGGTDDPTPTFTIGAGEVSAIGFVLRGLALDGGSLAQDGAASSSVGVEDIVSAPSIPTQTPGAIVLRLYTHRHSSVPQMVPTSLIGVSTALQYARVCNYGANNATHDWGLAATLQVAPWAGLGCGPFVVEHPTITCIMSTLAFLPK
jgi:hypothetical protein